MDVFNDDGIINKFLDSFLLKLNIALKVKTAISKRYRTNYAVGPISEVLCKKIYISYTYSWSRLVHCSFWDLNFSIYIPWLDYASGSSLDWVYDTLKVPLTYAFEFRGPETPFLPTDQIVPNALEVIDGIIAMIKQAKVLKYL